MGAEMILHACPYCGSAPEAESINVITDRFERDMEEIFRNWR